MKFALLIIVAGLFWALWVTDACLAAPRRCLNCQNAAADWSGGYRARVYNGWYSRQPYNYRLDFDYPWYAGPSRSQWPIRAPHEDPTWTDFEVPHTELHESWEPRVQPPTELLPPTQPYHSGAAAARVRRIVPVRRASISEGQQP